MDEKTKGLIIKIVIVLLVIGFCTFLGFVLRHHISMFTVTEVFVKCSADGKNVNDILTKNWNLSLSQTNDVYINIGHIPNPYTLDENKKYLKSFVIDNFVITANPKIGNNIKMYYINSNNERVEFTDRIVYNIVDTVDNSVDNQISTVGGQIALSFVNEDFTSYVYDNVSELNFNGELIKPTGITKVDLQFQISFDIVFETRCNEKYVYNMVLKLPHGNFIDNGVYIGDYPFKINLQ